MSYKDKLKKIISELTNQLEGLNQAEIKLKDNKSTYSDSYYKESLTKISRSKQDLKSATQIKYNDYSKELNNDINKWATPKGSDLDEEDLKLLSGYITLTQDEVTALGVKHQAKNTMIRAIKEYANKNEMYFAVTTGEDSMRESQQLIDSHFKRAMNNLDSYSFKVLQDDTTVDELTSAFDLLEQDTN